MRDKSQKRKEAEEMIKAWKNLTPEQQLAKLDERLGVGIGAKKQRARIQKQIEKNKNKNE